ncbi:MAG: tetratricopeptide repeat protein [bacterium]
MMTREETINFLRKKIEKNPKSILFARLADYYLKQKRVKEALKLCTRGIENNPDYITGNYILAKIYLTMGDHDKAETQLKKVISHDRYFLSAHKHLGDMMAKIGWENKAINHYKDILKLDPMEKEAAQMLDTFSLEETSEETGIFEDTSSITEEINEPEEAAQKTDVDSTEIDKELRKVFDEEKIPEEKPKKNIELEEVTSQDESTSEENKKHEDLKFELPDELQDSEALSTPQTPEAETQDTTDKSEETGSEEKESDAWVLPGDMTEKNISDEKKEGQELEDLEITKPSDQEKETEPPKDESDVTVEKSSPEEIDTSEKITSSKSEENHEEPSEEQDSETESAFDIKEPQEPSPESLDSEKKPTPPEKTEPLTEKKEEQEEIKKTEEIKEPSPPSKPEQSAGDTSEQGKPKKSPEPEKPETDSHPREEKTKEKESAKEDNLVTPTLGEIYSAQGQISKAIEVYKKLLEKNPDNKKYQKKIQELEKEL